MLVKRKIEESGTFVSEKEARVENEVPYLPTEIWITIFSFVQPNTLACCAMVCHQWHAFASDELIWQSLFSQNFGEFYFKVVDAFVKEKQLSWKNIYRIFPKCAFFVNKVWQRIICFYRNKAVRDSARQAGNPGWLDAFPPPFALNGMFGFSADISSKKVFAKRHNSNGSLCLTFEGDSKDVFTHLAVNKNLLFAATQIGDVVYWDIQSQKMQRFEKKETQLTSSPIFFRLDGEWIIKIYPGQLEVFSFENPEVVQVYNSTFHDPSQGKALLAMNVLENKLYLVGLGSVSIFDLKEGERIDDIEFNMPVPQLMCAKDNKMYIATHTMIYLVDLEDKSTKELMFLDAKFRNNPVAMSFFGDHFLLVFYEAPLSNSYCFSVIDIRTCQFITKNKAIKSDSLQNLISDLVHSCLDITCFPPVS